MKQRKIKHKTPKFFGCKDEKWAKGGGRHGYARHYGKNKAPGGHNIDHRTKQEKKNSDDRKLEEQDGKQHRLYAFRFKKCIQVWTFDDRGNNGSPILVETFASIADLKEHAVIYGWKYLDTTTLQDNRDKL